VQEGSNLNLLMTKQTTFGLCNGGNLAGMNFEKKKKGSWQRGQGRNLFAEKNKSFEASSEGSSSGEKKRKRKLGGGLDRSGPAEKVLVLGGGI